MTGNFATFEVGSNVNGFTLKNVKTMLDRVKYPNSYLLTAGPKSQYIKEKKLELFDPYVNCVLSGLRYENVYVNDEIVEDISPFIKEIEFNNLYHSALPFGKGRIEKEQK